MYTYSSYKLNSNGTSSGSKSISNGGIISFVPGVSYGLFKNLQVEILIPNLIALSYSYINTTTYSPGSIAIGNEKGNIFALNATLNSNLLYNFGFGFKFLLGK